jgi:putative transposase
MRTFKEECAWCHGFKTIEEAEEVINAWIDKYNNERMHSRLGYLSPAKFEEKLRKNAA